MSVRKDKTRGQHTMGDQLKEDQMRASVNQHRMNPKVKQDNRIDAQIQAPSRYTKEYLEQVARYNENVTILDANYSKLEIVGNILVRCFMYEVNVTPSGLIEPYQANIQVPTPSGVGKHEVVEVTVPYSLKAVLVAVPENYMYKAGTIVQLKPNSIKMSVIGDSKGWIVNPDNGFVKVGKHQPEPVSDITSPDYGYVTISYSDIQCILEKPNVEQV